MFRGDLEAGGHVLTFGDVTYIMGVINVSPESNNAHTVVSGPAEALDLARRYTDWGADMIEVGGQSSHYSAPTLSVRDEVQRLVPVVSVLAEAGMVVAVDTWKPEVAAVAVEAGASIVNDTGGLRLPAMQALVADSSVAAIAVHVDGANPHEIDRVSLAQGRPEVVAASFADLLDSLPTGLVTRTVVDPGIAINYRGDYAAYTRLQLDVIRRSHVFRALGRPLMIPIPRKSDIHRVTAYIAMALEYDADIIRVHDVAVAAGIRALWNRTPQ